jgi:hypothetical protein
MGILPSRDTRTSLCIVAMGILPSRDTRTSLCIVPVVVGNCSLRYPTSYIPVVVGNCSLRYTTSFIPVVGRRGIAPSPKPCLSIPIHSLRYRSGATPDAPGDSIGNRSLPPLR